MTKASLFGEPEPPGLDDEAAPPLSDSQRCELRERLAHHRASSDEPGVTLDEIRRRLVGSPSCS